MKLRFLLAALVFILFCGSPLLAANSDTGSPVIEVWKSTTCQCCGYWVKHLEANGFDVKVNTADTSLLNRVRKDAGIPDKLAGCHTAKIDGYYIEGHVPGTDIKRLMDEKPDAIGLTVPGMPMGAPGMEQGIRYDKYDVLLIKKDGTTEVFASH
jgi:hypothetical protein